MAILVQLACWLLDGWELDVKGVESRIAERVDLGEIWGCVREDLVVWAGKRSDEWLGFLDGDGGQLERLLADWCLLDVVDGVIDDRVRDKMLEIVSE